MHHACTATRNVQVRGLLLETLGQRALCAGWLIKLGTERKNWRKRFAVLLAEPTMQLRYYSDAQLSDCRGKLRPLHTSSRLRVPPLPLLLLRDLDSSTTPAPPLPQHPSPH